MASSRMKVGVISFLALAVAGSAALISWCRRPLLAEDPLTGQLLASGDAKEGVSLGVGEQIEAVPAPRQWEPVGRRWRLHVKQYQGFLHPSHILPKNWVFAPKVQAEFDVTVEVLPLRHRGDHDIARLRFTPGKGAPKHMADIRPLLEVDMTDGSYVEVKPNDFGMPQTIDFDGTPYLRTQMYGIPIDWITRNLDLAAVPATTVEQLEKLGEPSERIKRIEPVSVALGAGKERAGIRVTFEERFTHDLFEHMAEKRSYYRTVQTWVPGEHWWRSFQRIGGGSIQLEATLVETK